MRWGWLLRLVRGWAGKLSAGRNRERATRHGHGQYLKLIDKLPGILRFVTNRRAGSPTQSTYLNIFCYFLQPTPANICAMVALCAEGVRAGPALEAGKDSSAAA